MFAEVICMILLCGAVLGFIYFYRTRRRNAYLFRLSLAMLLIAVGIALYLII